MISAQPITIIGGGLAGLSLGIALGRAGVPTEIFEAGDYPRHRVCGEFITGLDDATIDKLGVDSALAGAGSHRSVTWFRHERMIGQQTLPLPARAISRFVLDARLADLFVAGGGKLATRSRVARPAGRAGWVETDGRSRVNAAPWIGLKFHVRNLAMTGDLELHLGDGAYVGISSVEDGWINVCGLFQRRSDLRFDRDDALLTYLRASGMPGLAERLSTVEIRAGSRSAVAGFIFSRCASDNGSIRLGDAWTMVPPFTGNGMAMAFISAALALDPLVAWAHRERSWEETVSCIQENLRRKFRLRLRSAALLHPFFLNRTLQGFLGATVHSGLLPITSLYRLLH